MEIHVRSLSDEQFGLLQEQVKEEADLRSWLAGEHETMLNIANEIRQRMSQEPPQPFEPVSDRGHAPGVRVVVDDKIWVNVSSTFLSQPPSERPHDWARVEPDTDDTPGEIEGGDEIEEDSEPVSTD